MVPVHPQLMSPMPLNLKTSAPNQLGPGSHLPKETKRDGSIGAPKV